MQADKIKLILTPIILVIVLWSGVKVYDYSHTRGTGYAPKQPIPFSHKLHAGEKKIDCQYCHSAVARSPHSNVPSANVCMNCHKVVKTDSPHIQKLHAAVKNNEPIQWVNVHVMPDYVYFNHQRHVEKGLDCTSCHGNVDQMDVVEVVAPLTMGWCVNCHRMPEHNAPLNCNTCHR